MRAPRSEHTWHAGPLTSRCIVVTSQVFQKIGEADARRIQGLTRQLQESTAQLEAVNAKHATLRDAVRQQSEVQKETMHMHRSELEMIKRTLSQTQEQMKMDIAQQLPCILDHFSNLQGQCISRVSDRMLANGMNKRHVDFLLSGMSLFP